MSNKLTESFKDQRDRLNRLIAELDEQSYDPDDYLQLYARLQMVVARQYFGDCDCGGNCNG